MYGIARAVEVVREIPNPHTISPHPANRLESAAWPQALITNGGIPPEEQPASHYRLLGIAEFESDADVIDGAAEQRTIYLRTFQTGPDAELAERLLNEVAAARVCLLRPATKAKYDDSLRDAITEAEPPPAIAEAPAPPVVFPADPQIAEVLRVVRPMIDNGHAKAVMGNHEFNAIAYHTPDPANVGRFLREHSEKNNAQHAETMPQLPSGCDYPRLPLFLQNYPLKVNLNATKCV